MKTYIGLDLGSKTLGIAISTSGIIANTYQTFRFKSEDYDEAISMLLDVITKEKVDVVVLGFPKHMNNDIGIRGQISQQFKEKLEQKTDAKVILWDERLSTQSALKVMQGSHKKDRKAKKDELAAVLILQNYLDSIR
ncbi:MAG: Holliday junction resolvase RuvX [Acholeplasmataceae bacterium]